MQAESCNGVIHHVWQCIPTAQSITTNHAAVLFTNIWFKSLNSTQKRNYDWQFCLWYIIVYRFKQTETWRKFAQPSLWKNCPKPNYFPDSYYFKDSKTSILYMDFVPELYLEEGIFIELTYQKQAAEQDFSQRGKLMVKLKLHNRNIIQATMMISVTWKMRCQEANVWALNHKRGLFNVQFIKQCLNIVKHCLDLCNNERSTGLAFTHFMHFWMSLCSFSCIVQVHLNKLECRGKVNLFQ